MAEAAEDTCYRWNRHYRPRLAAREKNNGGERHSFRASSKDRHTSRRGDMLRARGGLDRKRRAHTDQFRYCFSAARAVDSTPSFVAELRLIYEGGSRKRVRTRNGRSRRLQPVATVCEQFATPSVVGGRLKQFATACDTYGQQRRRTDSQRPGSGT